jgi:hypothetical protein
VYFIYFFCIISTSFLSVSGNIVFINHLFKKLTSSAFLNVYVFADKCPDIRRALIDLMAYHKIGEFFAGAVSLHGAVGNF